MEMIGRRKYRPMYVLKSYIDLRWNAKNGNPTLNAFQNMEWLMGWC